METLEADIAHIEAELKPLREKARALRVQARLGVVGSGVWMPISPEAQQKAAEQLGELERREQELVRQHRALLHRRRELLKEVGTAGLAVVTFVGDHHG